MGIAQVYELTVAGRHHRVETTAGEGWTHRATWWVDGEEIATEKSSTDTVLRLHADKDHEHADAVGALRVQFTTMGKPVRATWFTGAREEAIAQSVLDRGGIDLVPEAGSLAAQREERMRASPRLHAARHVAGGMGKVVGPIATAALFAWLLSRISLPEIDLGLPSIPWPSIPWPDIPWPSISLPSWDAPGWVRWIADKLKYIWPILLGLLLARREMSRRRQQDELRARTAAEGASGPASGGTDSAVRDVPTDEAEHPEDQQHQPAHSGDQ